MKPSSPGKAQGLFPGPEPSRPALCARWLSLQLVSNTLPSKQAQTEVQELLGQSPLPEPTAPLLSAGLLFLVISTEGKFTGRTTRSECASHPLSSGNVHSCGSTAPIGTEGTPIGPPVPWRPSALPPCPSCRPSPAGLSVTGSLPGLELPARRVTACAPTSGSFCSAQSYVCVISHGRVAFHWVDGPVFLSPLVDI